jgi:O-antigen ligase
MREKGRASYYWLYFSLILVALVYGGTSSIFAVVFLAYIHSFKSYRPFLITTSFIFILIFMSFALIWGDLQNYLFYKMDARQMAGAVKYIYDFDPNLLTRLALWMYAITIWFAHPLFGVGFGVEMFNPDVLMFSFAEQNKNDFLGYFLGAHNSIITLLARTGLIATSVFIFSVFSLLKHFYFKKNKLDSLGIISINCFLVSLSVLLLNVVIESPIASGFFWFTFGLAYYSTAISDME